MADPAIRLVDVNKRYGGLAVLDGVSLTIQRGERHVIIGPNGAGKSTLFHVASGRTPPTGGSVFLGDENVTALPPHERVRRGLGRSFQITNLFPQLTAFENLRIAMLWRAGEGYRFWRLLDRNRSLRMRVTSMLATLELSHRADVPVGLLSYAEQRAMEIGMAASCGTRAILLDEPTAGMSQAETERAVALIRKISVGRALLLVEHDMRVVFDLADRITVLVGGRVIASGTPAEIQADPAVQRAYLGGREN